MTSSLLQYLHDLGCYDGSSIGYIELDNNLCRKIYFNHPLGKAVVNSKVLKYLGPGRSIYFDDYENGIFEKLDGKERKKIEKQLVNNFKEVEKRMGGVQSIRNALTYSFVFGYSTTYLYCEFDDKERQKSVDKGLPLNYGEIREARKAKFLTADPLNTPELICQYPNDIDFMNTLYLTVAGVVYHRTRYSLMRSNIQIYNTYSSAGFSLSESPSIYENIIFPLIKYELVGEAETRYLLKLATLVLEGGESRDLTEGGNPNKVINLFKSLFRINNAGNDNLIQIQKDEKINYLGASSEIDFKTRREDQILQICVATLTDPTELTDKKHAGVISEGDNDALEKAKLLEYEREVVLSTGYDFQDPIVLARLCTDSYLDELRAKGVNLPKSNLNAYNLLLESFKYKYGAISVISEKEQAETEKLRAESYAITEYAKEKFTDAEEGEIDNIHKETNDHGQH